MDTTFQGRRNRGARRQLAPPDFPRFSTVGIDQTLKPIKVFKYWPPQIFVPSAGTGLLQAPGVYLEEHSYLDQLHT